MSHRIIASTNTESYWTTIHLSNCLFAINRCWFDSIVNKLISLEACPIILIQLLKDKGSNLSSVILTEDWIWGKSPGDAPLIMEAYSIICKSINSGIEKGGASLPLLLRVSATIIALVLISNLVASNTLSFSLFVSR